MGRAAGALARAGFGCVAVITPRQGNVRAVAVVVVGREIVVNAQLCGQIHDGNFVAKQVAVMDMPHAQSLEHIHQVQELILEMENQPETFILVAISSRT